MWTLLTSLITEIVKEKTMAADIVSDVSVVSVEDIKQICKEWGLEI